jgi:hypothetical protein
VKAIAIASGVWDVLDGIHWFLNFVYSVIVIALFENTANRIQHIKYAAPLFFLSNVPRIVLFFVMMSKGYDR